MRYQQMLRLLAASKWELSHLRYILLCWDDVATGVTWTRRISRWFSEFWCIELSDRSTLPTLIQFDLPSTMKLSIAVSSTHTHFESCSVRVIVICNIQRFFFYLIWSINEWVILHSTVICLNISPLSSVEFTLKCPRPRKGHHMKAERTRKREEQNEMKRQTICRGISSLN